MAQPANAEEYLERFNTNQKCSGFGIEEATIHMPCPFCAAPDFMVYRIIDAQDAMMKGGICKECGRGCQAVFQKSAHSTAFEFVQTVGADQPDWLTPKMRRVEE